jgi:hypothetical protein
MSKVNLISSKIYKNLTNVFEKGVVSLTLSILITVSNTTEMVHLKKYKRRNYTIKEKKLTQR